MGSLSGVGQLRSRRWCWTAMCCLLQAACPQAQSSYQDGAQQAPWAACSMMHQCFVMPHYLASADGWGCWQHHAPALMKHTYIREPPSGGQGTRSYHAHCCT